MDDYLELRQYARQARDAEPIEAQKQDAEYSAAVDYCFNIYKSSGTLSDELMIELERITYEYFETKDDLKQFFIDCGKELETTGDNTQINISVNTSVNTDLVRDYLKSGSISDFKSEAKAFRKYSERKTGFSNWDKQTSLYAGLYVLGAISSLGKTSFCLQLADQLASSGETVLYFSMEQTKLEMTSKSLSRYMFKHTQRRASAINIRRGYYDSIDPYKPNGEIEDDLLDEVIGKYSDEVQDRLYMFECDFDTTIEAICDYIDAFIAEKKISPVIFIDYLQIIKSEKFSSADKQRIDYIVEKLKNTQKKHSLVFFVISSLNRQNYLTTVDFESFKESGGIEFTADVILGLQLQILHEEIFNKEGKINEKRELVQKAKRENPRKIELICLKNRYGVANYSCEFDYFPQYDLFLPIDGKIDYKAKPGTDEEKEGFSSFKAYRTEKQRELKAEKRKQEREELRQAIEKLSADGIGTTTLELADYLGITQSSVKTKVKDLLPNYLVNGSESTESASVEKGEEEFIRLPEKTGENIETEFNK